MTVDLPWPPDPHLLTLLREILATTHTAWTTGTIPLPVSQPPPNPHGQPDPEWHHLWHTELSESLQTDIAHLQKLLHNPTLAHGTFTTTPTEADSLNRACSALRLHLRSHPLKQIPDTALETGQIPLHTLPKTQAAAYIAYAFLASLQTALIHAEHPPTENPPTPDTPD